MFCQKCWPLPWTSENSPNQTIKADLQQVLPIGKQGQFIIQKTLWLPATQRLINFYQWTGQWNHHLQQADFVKHSWIIKFRDLNDLFNDQTWINHEQLHQFISLNSNETLIMIIWSPNGTSQEWKRTNRWLQRHAFLVIPQFNGIIYFCKPVFLKP